jgi:hypothetical protein
MIRSKTWVKDRYFEYRPGDIVKLVRKKQNGHPRALELGKNYKVLKVENEDLFVNDVDRVHFNGGTYVKVNRNYFVPIDNMRDELIKDILSND